MQQSQFVQDSMALIREYIRKDDGTRLDAGETDFLERQLESVDTRLYQKKLRQLKYRELIPVSNRDNAGAQTLTYYMYTKVGMAKIIANPADDLPRADIYATRTTANVYSIGASFGFSTQELRAAQFAGVPLEMQKVNAVTRAINEKENNIAWNGESTYNIPGFLNNANIPTVQAPLNAGSTSRKWVDKTPLEIIADVTTMVSGIRTATNGVQEGDTLLLPIDQFTHISTTPMDPQNASNITIMEYILKNESMGIKKIDWLSVELTGTGTGATDMAMLYERDPEVLEQRIPMERMQHPPQMQNLEYKVPVEARNGGVVVRYPLACRSMYGI